MLAIIKLDCVYLPIAPDTPLERINYILNDSKSKFVIVNNEKKYDIKTININETNYLMCYPENLDIKINIEDS